MPFYTNHTRHTAVLTINIISANDPKGGVKIGVKGALIPHAVHLGYNDIPVPAGVSLELMEGVNATFVAVRTAE